MINNFYPFFSVGDQEHGTTLNQSQLPLTSFTSTTNNKAATTTSHTALHTHSSVHTTQDTPAHIGPSASSVQDLSTTTTTTTTAAPSPPKVFKEICSILPLSSGGKKKRYDLSNIILMLKEYDVYFIGYFTCKCFSNLTVSRWLFLCKQMQNHSGRTSAAGGTPRVHVLLVPSGVPESRQ